MSDLKQIGFRLPAKLIESLDKYAAEIGGTRTDVITRLLEEGIARLNNGDTVIKRQTALNQQEIEDAFTRLATPLIQRIEALEKQETKPAPNPTGELTQASNDKLALQAYRREIAELKQKIGTFEKATALLEDALTLPRNNGSRIQKAIRNYLTAIEAQILQQ